MLSLSSTNITLWMDSTLVHSKNDQELQNSKPLTTDGIFYLGKCHGFNLVVPQILSMYITSSRARVQTSLLSHQRKWFHPSIVNVALKEIWASFHEVTCRSTALHILNARKRLNQNGQLHVMANFSLGKSPHYPLDDRLGRHQSWPGQKPKLLALQPLPCHYMPISQLL